MPIADQDCSASDPPPGDEELFRRQMEGVSPLLEGGTKRVAAPSPACAARVERLGSADPDGEALAELSDLVSGRTGFDITDTDEYVEGAVRGLDPRLIKKLRQGGFARQAHLDLHGMTSDAAAASVEEFLNRAAATGLRTVLVVHGRGRNSPQQVPVLKDRLIEWLSRGKLAKRVLAFATARPYDGGAGAMYVLLRRTRGRKRPIVVLEGAKLE